MQQFSSLLSWRSFTAQHVSGVLPSIIRSSMTAVAASGFTFVSWWQSCCVRGRAGYNRPDHEHSTLITTKRSNNTHRMHCCISLQKIVKRTVHTVLRHTYITYLVLSSRWLWTVVTFFACAGAVFVILHSWQRYVASPTVVALEKGYRQWPTLFPAITICPLQNLGSNGSELEVRR
jgi:hypothetical protein